MKDRHAEDMVNIPYETLTHALELRPCIEEPSPTIPQFLNFESMDLRPRIRHDFFLLNRDDVDEYWNTLEYCYAATDPKAAIKAFPGSAVHEVIQKWPLSLFFIYIFNIYVSIYICVYICKVNIQIYIILVTRL